MGGEIRTSELFFISSNFDNKGQVKNMTKKYCDSPIHKCLCLSLSLIFIFTIVLSVPASADSVRPNEPVGWKDGDTFRDILLAVLDSWGISFSKADPSDDTSILELSDQLMQEFYDANETTQELFWDLVQYGASETGNIILDFLGVNKIRQFANWLKDKFSLSDNSSLDISVGNSSIYVLSDGISSVNVRVLPAVWYNENLDERMIVSNISPVYYYAISAGNTATLIMLSDSPFTITSLPNGASHTAVYTSSYYSSDSNGLYVIYLDTFNLYFPSEILYDNSSRPVVPSTPWTVTPIGSSSSLNLVINTDVLDIPSEDMDPDDGLQIEVPGTNWGDSIYTILNIIERLIGLYDSTQLNINTVIDLISTLLQGLQKSVSVENIPGAVILDYDDYDIPLETEWSLVDGFFSEETEGSPFSALTTIIYGFPEPFVLFFSVIVVFVVAYGFIRMGRDSH